MEFVDINNLGLIRGNRDVPAHAPRLSPRPSSTAQPRTNPESGVFSARAPVPKKISTIQPP